jgi:hypothetical protein
LSRAADERRLWLLAAAAIVALAAWIAIGSPLGGDYAQPGCTTAYACDDPAVSIRALATGNLHTFFALQPTMGIVSLLLRAPFARLGTLFGNSDLTLYRLGVFACVAAAGGLGVWVAVGARKRLAVPVLAATLLCLGWCINPITFRAIFWGHPEEILGAALLGSAAARATMGHPRQAGALLAAAFATKQWAALAFPAVLLMLPAWQRLAFGVTTLVVAAVLVVPMYAGNPHRFTQAAGRISADASASTPTNVWWKSSVPATVGYTGGARVPTEFARRISHPLIAAAVVALSLLWWRRRWDPFALLAIVMLVRCLLDPLNLSYLHAPFFVAVLAFDVLALRRWPWTAAAAAILLQMTIWLSGSVAPATMQVLYLGWTLPFLAYLAVMGARRRPVYAL